MTKYKKIIPIFFAVDNNYAPFLTVVLESIIENSSKDYFYQVNILNNDISIEHKQNINKYNSNNLNIHFYSITTMIKELNKDLQTRDYYTNAIYYRLFIPEIFKEYDKAIYLDADIIVLDDISKLYEENINDFCLGVVSDDVVKSRNEFIEYSEKGLGVETHKYFNSGILLMNLKKMREELILKKFLRMLDYVKFIVAPDQDYLNVICYDKVKYLNANWNVAPLNGVKITDDVKIIHFKLTFKPWHYSGIEGQDKFWFYAKKTNYYQELLNILKNYDGQEKDKLVEQNLSKLAACETIRLINLKHENRDFNSVLGD